MAFDGKIHCPLKLLRPVSEIAAAYVANNHVAVSELPALLARLHAELSRISGQTTGSPTAITKKPTASEIRSSLSHEGITSFLDGRTYKALKRHITRHGLTPETYRRRYGLPPDYPMVSPAYSARRTAISKAIGLSRSQKASIAVHDEQPARRQRKAA